MSETTTDRAPWCPMTGHPVVHRIGNVWRVGCIECGFALHGYESFGQDEANTYARRLIRAELARQALEMRAHSVDAIMYGPDAVTLNMSMEHAYEAALEGYDWLGAHPLRLPGEGEA